MLFVLMLSTSIQLVYAQKSNTKLTEEQRIKFDQHFINANKFLMVKQPDDALKEIKQAELIDAENGALNFITAQIYLQKKLTNRCRKICVKSCKVKSGKPMVQQTIGRSIQNPKTI